MPSLRPNHALLCLALLCTACASQEAGGDTAAASDAAPRALLDGAAIALEGPSPAGLLAGCTEAPRLALVQGQATVKGSTLGAPAPTGVRCGYCAPLAGPHVSYRVELDGERYLVGVTASFAGVLFLFDGGCAPAAVEAACARPGWSAPFASGTTTLGFSPPQPGTYHLALGSVEAARAGDFTLQLKASSGECTEADCGSPEGAPGYRCSAPVLLKSGAQTVVGSTLWSHAGTAVSCGGAALGDRQVYYSLPLVAGQSTTFTLTPQLDAARLYVFGASCEAAAIGASCSQGAITPPTPLGVPSSVSFTPPATGTYHLAVGSTCAAAYGPFTITIK